jgi:hypothetical protein
MMRKLFLALLLGIAVNTSGFAQSGPARTGGAVEQQFQAASKSLNADQSSAKQLMELAKRKDKEGISRLLVQHGAPANFKVTSVTYNASKKGPNVNVGDVVKAAGLIIGLVGGSKSGGGDMCTTTTTTATTDSSGKVTTTSVTTTKPC